MNIYRIVLFTLIIGKAFAELRICLPIEQLCSIGKMDDPKQLPVNSPDKQVEPK